MMAIALVNATAAAQGADTTRTATDTAVAPAPPQSFNDTLKAPLAAFREPAQFELDSAYRWNREAIFRLGDLTLDEFLDRIPGATSYRTGWLGSPALVAYSGDFSRVRIFLDGIEMNAVNPHANGLLDLSRIKIWTLEEIAVERGADELRVYLTTWRVERTTPGTRTDIVTGDQETNLYRGFFGKRFKHGEALQVGAQQYGYSSGIDAFGGGDELSLFARLGWARPGFSIDAYASRASLTRDAQPQLNGSRSIPFDKNTRTDAYARLGLGNSRSGGWLQLIAASQSISEDPAALQPGDEDSTFSVLQYVAAAGYTRGGLRLSAAGRVNDPRTPRADRANTITSRASWQGRYFGAGVHADFRDGDSVSLAELSIQLRPTSWLSASVTGARRDGGPLESPLMSARGELGLRLGGMWLLGGVLAADTTHGLIAPILFDTLFLKADEARAPLGFYGGMRGRLYHDLFIDAQLTRWRERGLYRPQYDGRAEAYIDTRWLSRFPSGSFGFRGGVAYLYRDRSFFPALGGTLDTPTIMRALRMQLEVRILDGTLFWQQRYMLLPSRPEMVPGYGLPRQTNIYGIRWQFWN